MEGEIRRIEKEVKKEKTGEELLKEAEDRLDTLIIDVQSINKDTPPGQRKIWWSELTERINLFREAAERLVEEGIELKRKGNVKEGSKKIQMSCNASNETTHLYPEFIHSMQKIGSPIEEIREQRKKLIENEANSVHLYLKAIILGDEERYSKPLETKKLALIGLDISLRNTKEEREKALETRHNQIKIWEEELRRQKKEMERRKEI